MCSFAELRPRRQLLAVLLTAALTATSPAAIAPLAPEPAQAVQDTLWYQQCANGGTSMIIPYAQSGFTQGTSCPTSSSVGWQRGIWTIGTWPVPGHNLAHWEVDAPPNIRIVAANVPEMSDSDGSYYWGQYFYWDSGNSGCDELAWAPEPSERLLAPRGHRWDHTVRDATAREGQCKRELRRSLVL